MNKDEVLSAIKTLTAQSLLTKEEILEAYGQGAGVESQEETRRTNFSQILYGIGGAIVFIGIAIFIGQNWEKYGSLTKILATLGSGIAAFWIGVLFNQQARYDKTGQAFFLISALVMPIGLYVAFDRAGLDVNSAGIQTFITAMLLGTFLVSYYVFKKKLFVVFGVIFGTWFFFEITNLLAQNTASFNMEKFYEYRALLTGLAYMFLGYYFLNTELEGLSGPLYGFGSLGFLGAGLFLGGWSPSQSVFWEVIYPGIVFAIIFLSIQLKSRAFLIFGSIYLMVYILKITSEYFTQGLGWPLALVIAGLGIIAVGHYTYNLGKKYVF